MPDPKPISNSRILKKEQYGLPLLLALAALIGLFSIIRTELISKDGVKYIHHARGLPGDFTRLCAKMPPGFPLLLYGAHRLVSSGDEGPGHPLWIYSSQAAVLLTQIGALVFLWKIGKKIVGPADTFWGILILITLPPLSNFAVDVLRDWPHVLFLAAAFYVILINLPRHRLPLYLLAALISGLGYLIRPESFQILLYLAGIFLVRFWKDRSLPNGVRCGVSFLLIFGAWLLPVLPHLVFSKTALPDKLTEYPLEVLASPAGGPVLAVICAPACRLAAAGLEFVQGVSENLMFYYVPAWAIGLWVFARKAGPAGDCPKSLPGGYLILNTLVLLWLHVGFGYISSRHYLPLLFLGCLFIPEGLRRIAFFLDVVVFKRQPGTPSKTFGLLIAAGLLICLPRLSRPLHHDKAVYRQAARWLSEHTEPEAVIVCEDPRIPFYARRRGISRSKEGDYSVLFIRDDQRPPLPKSFVLQKQFQGTGSGERIEIFKIRKSRPPAEPADPAIPPGRPESQEPF